MVLTWTDSYRKRKKLQFFLKLKKDIERKTSFMNLFLLGNLDGSIFAFLILVSAFLLLGVQGFNRLEDSFQCPIHSLTLILIGQFLYLEVEFLFVAEAIGKRWRLNFLLHGKFVGIL
jgi:accessory gene regulator protein AgrB